MTIFQDSSNSYRRPVPTIQESAEKQKTSKREKRFQKINPTSDLFVESCQTLSRSFRKLCQSQETLAPSVQAERRCCRQRLCWHHRISRLSRHVVKSISELLSPQKGALGHLALLLLAMQCARGRHKLQRLDMAQNGFCILGTRRIQEVQRSRMWCRWCVGHPMLSKFAGQDPNWLVHFQIPDLLQNLFYIIWTTWPNDLVLQNVYLYGWSEFGLGSGGWHDRLTSDTMIIANCWQLFWMFLWDAFKEFSPLSHVHVHPTCDRSCWGDAIDWRQYWWMVSAIVGTHLGRATMFCCFAYPFDVFAARAWSFSNSSRQHWDKTRRSFHGHIDESIYHCHISFWQF